MYQCQWNMYPITRIEQLPVTLGSKIFNKTQLLTSGEWGCLLYNGPNLAVGSQIEVKKTPYVEAPGQERIIF